jgi:NADH-quinone oxidoreductase subunit L
MTGVLMLLALLSAVGGFIAVPHFLEVQWPLPAVNASLAPMQGTLIGAAVAIGFAGLALAWLFFGGDGQRAARLQASFAPLHKLLTNKYYVDELYDLILNQPLLWLSDKVFLGLGDRRLIDGTLNGLAALAVRVAGRLGRIQTGSLNLYMFLVVVGLVMALAWGLRHV